MIILIMIMFVIYLGLENTSDDTKIYKESLCTGKYISKEGNTSIVVTDKEKDNFEMIYQDKDNIKATAKINNDQVEITYKIKEINPETEEEYETEYTTKYYQEKGCKYITFEDIKYYKEN